MKLWKNSKIQGCTDNLNLTSARCVGEEFLKLFTHPSGSSHWDWPCRISYQCVKSETVSYTKNLNKNKNLKNKSCIMIQTREHQSVVWAYVCEEGQRRKDYNRLAWPSALLTLGPAWRPKPPIQQSVNRGRRGGNSSAFLEALGQSFSWCAPFKDTEAVYLTNKDCGCWKKGLFKPNMILDLLPLLFNKKKNDQFASKVHEWLKFIPCFSEEWVVMN